MAEVKTGSGPSPARCATGAPSISTASGSRMSPCIPPFATPCQPRPPRCTITRRAPKSRTDDISSRGGRRLCPDQPGLADAAQLCRADRASPRDGRMGRTFCAFSAARPTMSPPAFSARCSASRCSASHGEARAQALLDYFDYASRNDLYLSYVIINPQADRIKPGASRQEDLVARLVDEDFAGLTSAAPRCSAPRRSCPTSCWSLICTAAAPAKKTSRFPSHPDRGPRLKMLSRKSYEAHAVSPPTTRSPSPSTRTTRCVWFEDVKVPWERVFVHRDADMCRAQFHDTLGHTFQNYQAQIRLMVKCPVSDGMARRRRDDRHRGVAAGARNARSARGAGGDGRRHGRGMEAGHMQDGY